MAEKETAAAQNATEKGTTQNVGSKSKVTSKVVKALDLKLHPRYKEIYISPNEALVEALAKDIKERSGLKLQPLVNKDLEILSGAIRVEACKKLGYDTLEVIVVDVPEEDELEFIIASNHHREKNIYVMSNEVMVLREQYLKRQGSNGGGEHTNKLISRITGLSTDMIQKIVKINEQCKPLVKDIATGKKSLHAAYEDACLVEKMKELNTMLDTPVVAPTETSEIRNAFSDMVKDYAEQKEKPEYRKMIDDKVVKPREVLKALKEDITVSGSNEPAGETNTIQISMCPMCGAKVRKKEVKQKLTKHSTEIVKFRDNLGIVA